MIEFLIALFASMGGIIVIALVIILLASLKVVNQFERGVKFTLGKYVGIMEPGLNIIVPVIQSWQKVDIRTKVIDVPKQDAMTKDNVSAIINAVIYFKVATAEKAIIEVLDFKYAVSQLAQTTMRDVVGEFTLDELLSSRELIASKIKEIIDKASDPWGIKVEAVELKEIILPDSLIRIISQEAEAEREKRGILIKAQGELESSKNLAIAAKKLSETKGGIHLRTLQTIANLGGEKSKTVIYAIPSELLKNFGESGLGKLIELFKK